jgi:hypothetical protein
MLAGLGLLAVIAVGIVTRGSVDVEPVGPASSNFELRSGPIDQSGDLAIIRRELAELRALIESAAATSRSSAQKLNTSYTSLADRILALEGTVERLSGVAREGVSGDQSPLADMSRRRGTKVQSSGDGYRPNPEGDDLFLADDEPTSDVYDKGIASAFEDVDTLFELNDVYCKQSVCKVSYKPREGRKSASASMDMNELLNSISQNMNGASLNARHAREEDGSLTMYLQLR